MNLTRVALASLLSFFLATSAVFGQDAAAKPKVAVKASQRWAILVGVNDYANLNKLEFCSHDMEALRDVLVASGFPKEQVFLLHDKAEENRYRPSRNNIDRQLDIVLNVAEPDDLVLVAFSGHGINLDKKSYLCPNDADIDDPATTMVALDRIYEQLSECPAALKVFLVDACRNDPLRSGQKGARGAKSGTLGESVPKGILQLTSCDNGEISMESPEFKHGVFMNYVLEGLQGKADADSDSNGRISLLEMYRYANKQTKLYVARTFNSLQRPGFKGDMNDDFDITSTVARNEPNVPMPRPTVPVPLSEVPATPPTVKSNPLGVESVPARFLVAPFSESDAKSAQSLWASHLKKRVVEQLLGMEMTLIPPGQFFMGCTQADLQEDFVNLGSKEFNKAGDHDNETPQHKVSITKPYYLGVYEVTKGQFAQFVQATGHRTTAETSGINGNPAPPGVALGGIGYNARTKTMERGVQYRWWEWGVSQSEGSPVVNVSWDDAQAFCKWLSLRARMRLEFRTWAFRLPTEAEWEYACRAGTTSRLSSEHFLSDRRRIGNVADESLNNYLVDYPRKTVEYDDSWPFTAPGGTFAPNAWGLHDMYGNVSEWCSDAYDPNYYAVSPARDPRSSLETSDRVSRGGSWTSALICCRSSHRNVVKQYDLDAACGFRVVLAPD